VGNADFLDTFDHPSPALEGIIVSIYNLGCFTGCILTFIFAEKTGRKLAMWIAMVWIIVSVAVAKHIHDTDRDRLAPSSKQLRTLSLI
jgi:MFS family permease